MSPDTRTWAYGPNGEAQIFDSPADVPAGWKDHPPKSGLTDAEEAELQRLIEEEAAADAAKAAAAAKPARKIRGA